MQAKPGSGLHAAEQPSPSAALPSSHTSLPSTMPLPHLGVQAPIAGQVGSQRQSAVQPSIGTVLPSSQHSVPSFLPSPHIVFRQGIPGVAQTQPISTWHVLEQPSPDVVFVSSHASAPSFVPLPHAATMMHGLPGCVQRNPASTRH